MAGFVQALPVILEYEGGFVDDPKDRGGATNRGITQATFDEYRKSMGQGVRSVRDLADDEMQDIYFRRFWLVGKCDGLPWPASLVHFDSVVQHGPKNAAILLQRAVGTKEDGAIGPTTLGLAAQMPGGRLVRMLIRHRLNFYRKIVAADASQGRFLAGWLGRILKLWDRCIADYSEAA